jgi:hypothetical protein
MKVAASPPSRAGDETTKKLTLKLSHWTLRRLVTGALSSRPEIRKVISSPRRIPRVSASPASTENCGGASAPAHQSPATTWLSEGKGIVWLKLNSRAASCWARGLA